MQTYANYYYIATFKRCYMFILLFLNSYYHESKQFCIMYTEEGVSVVEKKTSHISRLTQTGFSTSLTSRGTFPSHTVFKLICHSRLQSFHHWLPGNPDQKTDSLLIYWGWQSSPCVSPYCWCCCWWHWMKAVSMASAIIHWDVIIMFFVILSCKMLFSLKCLILSFKGSNKYCCTRYQQNPVSVKRLKSYTVQDDNCKLKAIM